MNKVIDLVVRFSGLGKLLEKVNGGKAYLGGAGLIISGAATALSGLAGIIGALVPLANASDYLSFAKGLPQNSSAGLLVAGLGMISKGLADIGNRHAVAKLEAKIDAPAAPAAPAQ